VDFKDVVTKRRMVRNYTYEPIDADAIGRIIDAGIRAPSAGFSQGQRFVVVTAPEQRHAIARAAGEDQYVAQGFDPWISKAPVHIVVCADKNAYLSRYSEPDKTGPDGRPSQEEDWIVPYWWVDAGGSMMAILLAAVDEGLAAGFLGAHSFEGIQSVVQTPDDILIVGVVTVGHPAPDRRSSSITRGRTPRSRVVFDNRWGGEDT
jgi:nitroreductase